MGSIYGHKIITNDLQLYYDIGNSKSYKGEPTINLLVQPLFFETGYTYESWIGEIEDNAIIAPDGCLTATRVKRTNGYFYKRNTTSPIFTLSEGDTFTFSCWILKLDGTDQTGIGIWCYDISSGVRVKATETVYENKWVKQEATYTALSGESSFAFIFSGSGFLTGEFAMWHPQVELKSYSTPFVNGERTNTDNIIDLTGKNSITATSLTYASDNLFSFNGTSDYITCGDDLEWSGALTVSTWANRTIKDTVCADGIVGNWYWSSDAQTRRGWCQRYYINKDTLNCMIELTNGSLVEEKSVGYVLEIETWYNLVTVFNPVDRTWKLYVNSVLRSTATGSSGYNLIAYDSPTSMMIGRNPVNSGYFNGNIANVKIYNNALTQTEITQNFNALRGRFSI